MKIQRIGGPENAQNRWAKPLQVREVMDGVWRFQDLVAWQLEFELTSTVDTICLRPDVRRDPKFHSQLSDAAASGPRNIAEGFG